MDIFPLSSKENMDAYLMTSLVIVLGAVGILALPWRDADIAKVAVAWSDLGILVRRLFRCR